MADPVIKPSAVAAAIATPTPVAVPAATAPKVKPAVTPPAKPSAASPNPARSRPQVSAKKALGLEETPAEASATALKKLQAQAERNSPITRPPAPKEIPVVAVPALPDLPEPAPAAPEPDPVVAAPVAPAKIKIGDKEYTAEELAAENARLVDEAARRNTPPPAPVAAAPAPPQPTPAEIAAREEGFIARTAQSLPAEMTEAEIDTILAGGKDAVAALQKFRQRDMATAIMHARKGMAQALDPIITQILSTITPLAQNQQQITEYNVEQQFLAKHKDFAPHAATAKQVAMELAKRYPDQVRTMSQEQFIDEVARQTDVVLATEHRRWFPAQNGNWRTGAATPAATPATVVPAVAAAPAAPAPPAAPPAARPARAPAATAPIGTGPGVSASWGKSVAATLRG